MEMKRIQIFRNVKKCIKIFEFLKSKAMHHKTIAIKVLDRFNQTGRIASHRRAFHACFAGSTNEFYFYRQYTYIVFILQCEKSRKACQI
jgi:hypothetical protein